MDATLEGITIADARVEDSPLIYVNRAFARITGYSVAETIGKNCRFLQGPGTDQATVARLRAAVRAGRPAAVQLVREKGGAGTQRVLSAGGRAGPKKTRNLDPEPALSTATRLHPR